MEIIHLKDTNLQYWQNKSRANVVALGFFDGVHTGHQHVIETAKAAADAQHVSLDVMSFFPHPKTVLSDGRTVVQYLMTLDEKAKVLEALGVDRFYIVDFTKAFAALPPEAYIEEYLYQFGTVHAVAGYDFTYGAKGAGTIGTLYDTSGGRITATEIGKVACHGEKVSSTLIREMILAGRMQKVETLMGRPFTTHTRISNGHFQHRPACILPASGYYDVMLESRCHKRHCTLYVDNEGNHIGFTDQTLLKHFNNRHIKITWCKQTASFAARQYATV
ncbi:FAD synthetase family protein [Lacicoccus alkaliphilus]|uniref:FAD synthase n=1 Tax=Lacicoccus alkaliphilus DSM 16010 TaxID=1123231 RepID=A0A1M7KRK1_9BACL|nr:FAD synthetase family protein [Salinicoccus alkaliphilus]SHM68129.1 riboflavin kinase / FMN adenylyltransferase [Salinicoccus alkaliphilus DSM 16010]